MASFLSQAASYLGRTALATNYTIDTSPSAPPVRVGLWTIRKATRNSASGSGTSGPGGSASAAGGAAAAAVVGSRVVSIWTHTFDTRGSVRAAVTEQLKKEASALTRLRHPCVLEVVEPLEETRTDIAFATEHVVASLNTALIADSRSDIELDEVEIQKGLVQLARGLEFLHGAKMVHGNLTTESVLINSKGDWKLSGFSFLTSLFQPDGTTPTPWTYPSIDHGLPPALSRNFDYLAPEYALDEKLTPSNDMFALGCILYAVHSKGAPPFRNRGSINTLKENADRLGSLVNSTGWARLPADVLELLRRLLTRFPDHRINATDFQNSNIFSDIRVSALKFMDRDSFAGRSKDERVSFLKGLLGILPQFSEKTLRRKVLPAVLELMTDRSLLPFILPNVFHISKNLSLIEFSTNVLPRLKPLFSIQDPPQNMLMLLDQIELFVSKTSPPTFREDVMPLIYSSLEAEQIMVQERALQAVPRLCELLEYSHVKEVLLPKILALFSKTKVLSVKCNTLICFHSMISVLDKHTLTEKLVPVLAKIKTKEPGVMIATLAVHDAMSKKVDIETIATQIIPQLWVFSVGPLLNAEQFSRFMTSIKAMSKRVEDEHLAHLKEVRRMQEHTESYVANQGTNGSRAVDGTGLNAGTGEISFAALVGGASAGGPKAISGDNTPSRASADPFGLDDFGPALTPHTSTPSALTPNHTGLAARPTPKPAGPTRTESISSLSGAARPALAPPPASTRQPSPLASSSITTTNTTASRPAVQPPPGWGGSVLSPSNSSSLSSSTAHASSVPSFALTSTNGGLPPLIPTQSSLALGSAKPFTANSTGPNYNISLSAAPSSTPSVSAPLQPVSGGARPLGSPAPPSWNTVLQPANKSGGSSSSSKPVDLSGFDPFS
ncbi:Protein kinase domain-containing protein ppk32 [Tilletia horrida]|uniref:Protein kinase domain-containing protein ppk32 n=1 Tax=Tilletia horrida TaxID=155126 RepID=A0AAN6JUV5_9BASI|nr:Protein kinase domain-containing protein ppk32 [Tilletia horrida]KAK0553468.1 Protein kinase domain-containing protein ppk32 [Tilletia horrida]KAK0567998.1 Protein kinase domain-containing protein ppk32 [Tilletia horrida]